MANRILNSPYFEPIGTLKSDNHGVTDEIFKYIKISSFYIQVSHQKNLDEQLKIDSFYTQDELNSNKYRPFLKPTNVKIAVKVINHYGDEGMKIINI